MGRCPLGAAGPGAGSGGPPAAAGVGVGSCAATGGSGRPGPGDPPGAVGECGAGVPAGADSTGRGVGSTGASNGLGVGGPTGRPPGSGSALGTSTLRPSRSLVRPALVLLISLSAPLVAATSPTHQHAPSRRHRRRLRSLLPQPAHPLHPPQLPRLLESKTPRHRSRVPLAPFRAGYHPNHPGAEAISTSASWLPRPLAGAEFR